MILVPALVGAAPEQDQSIAIVRSLLVEDGAVATTGYRLAAANVDLCRDHMIESGLLIETLAQYGAEYRAAAASVLNLTDRPTVALVVSGSPAARAGIKPGDALIDADRMPFAAAPPSSREGVFAPVDAAMGILDAALADGVARLTVLRDGQRVAVDVTGIAVCRGRFQVLPGSDADASANGTWVQISTTMAALADTPDELAAILGHELAHNALGHRKASPRIQRVQELQADRLMPYLMARAGFDPQAAVTLWQRLKRKRLGGLFPSATHPGWTERIRAVSVECAKIEEMRVRGGAILPPEDLRAR